MNRFDDPDWVFVPMKIRRGPRGPSPGAGTPPKKIGEVTIIKKGKKSYFHIKTKPRKWELLHKVIWRSAMGEIPKGTIIRFKDRNTLNCDLSNLYANTKYEQMINEVSINRYNPELVNLIRLCGKLKRKIKEHAKQNGRLEESPICAVGAAR